MVKNISAVAVVLKCCQLLFINRHLSYSCIPRDTFEHNSVVRVYLRHGGCSLRVAIYFTLASEWCWYSSAVVEWIELSCTNSFVKKFCCINNVDKTLLLGLPRKQNGCPIGYIMLLSIISPLKRGVQRLWRLMYGLLTMAMLVGPLMGIKDTGKVRNRRVAKLRIFLIPILIFVETLFHDNSFMDVDTAV